MTKGFVQVPPQSTGKKVATEERTELYYDNSVAPFLKGQVVTGATSGATGTVTGVQTEGFSAAEGELYLSGVTGTFVNDENLQVDNSTVAIAKIESGFPLTDFALQKVIITDPSNIENNQAIDRFGATLNTFNDGSPQFSPFGTMVTSEPFPSKYFTFQYDNMDSDFYDEINGTASTTRSTTNNVTLLSTGTGATDQITRTSHYYQSYYAGVGNDVLMSLQIGDAGKTNVVRRWGLFDDNNGVFFELDGTTFSVNIRTNTSGSPVDTKILKENFNVDRLDGTDGISFELDVTKGNIYWIDYQWLGTGRIRFGVFEPGGAKLVAHTVEHANLSTVFPYTKTGTFPFRMEQYNTGVAASTSELRCACAVMRHMSKIIPDGIRQSKTVTPVTAPTASGEVPIVSIRPKQTFNGEVNRTKFKATSVTGINTGSEPCVLRIRACLDTNLTGESFASHATDSTNEVDTAATAINTAGTKELLTLFVAPGKDFTLENQFASDAESHKWENFLYADGTTQPILTVTCETLSGTSTDIGIGVNWEESRV